MSAAKRMPFLPTTPDAANWVGKVRYRGLEKNAYRLFVTCTRANLFIARRHLLRWQGV